MYWVVPWYEVGEFLRPHPTERPKAYGPFSILGSAMHYAQDESRKPATYYVVEQLPDGKRPRVIADQGVLTAAIKCNCISGCDHCWETCWRKGDEVYL